MDGGREGGRERGGRGEQVIKRIEDKKEKGRLEDRLDLTGSSITFCCQ